MHKKFLKFRYAAIKRFGDKKFNATDGYIEFNSTYVVSLSNDESGILSQGNNRAFVVELSNGTKFITVMNMQNVTKTTVLLSEAGETLNALADTAAYIHAADNIGAYNRHSAIN